MTFTNHPGACGAPFVFVGIVDQEERFARTSVLRVLLTLLNDEVDFCTLSLGLVLEHLLDKFNDFHGVKDGVVLFINATLNHFEVQLIVDEAL